MQQPSAGPASCLHAARKTQSTDMAVGRTSCPGACRLYLGCVRRIRSRVERELACQLIHQLLRSGEVSTHGFQLSRGQSLVNEHGSQHLLRLRRHRAKVVPHHLEGLAGAHAAHVDLLVDTARSDERGVQLLGVIGGHDDDAVGCVNHSIQDVQDAGQAQLIITAKQGLAECGHWAKALGLDRLIITHVSIVVVFLLGWAGRLGVHDEVQAGHGGPAVHHSGRGIHVLHHKDSLVIGQGDA
mmetsp:Transcript_3472/g.7579  ORF Transcript_3472/g.7579 Transcript_3472/m.7579 type:complete len:241 (-) Transcript_3472:1262-1984(-)